MKTFKEFAFDYMEQLQHALEHLNLDKVQEAVDLISNCRGTIWLIGNGGSAALASHMATDLQLAGKRAVALTDVAAVTTYGNDKSFQDVFSSQLQVLSTKADVLIAITGSGQSANINQAMIRFKGKAVAITGFHGGTLGKLADMTGSNILHINVPAKHMGVSQDGHQIVLHMICYFLLDRKKIM